MVSIIIPVYNVYEYIDRCLTSVVEQSYSDFEVILIDDGSTDGSIDKCRKWEKKDPRIRLIHKQNEGLGATRNLGIDLARYEYITFLDSDDWWDIHYLEYMLKPIQQYNLDIVCCDIHYWQIDEDLHVLDHVSKLRITNDIIISPTQNRECIHLARTFMWGKIIRKSLFLEYDIRQPNHAYEDIPIMPLLIALSKKIYRVPYPLYYYFRNRKGSLSNDSKKLHDMNCSLKELIQNFEQTGLFEQYSLQLKKLYYGQVRAAIQKSKELCDSFARESIKETFLMQMYNIFPELVDIHSILFYICDNDLIKKVLKLVVLDSQQIIVEYKQDYDCIYQYQNSQYKIDFQIMAKVTMNETQLWDWADQILYKILTNDKKKMLFLR